MLEVEHGPFDPELHRLESKGWIAAKREPTGKDLKREFKYYWLTLAGRKRFTTEKSEWKQSAPFNCAGDVPREEN